MLRSPPKEPGRSSSCTVPRCYQRGEQERRENRAKNPKSEKKRRKGKEAISRARETQDGRGRVAKERRNRVDFEIELFIPDVVRYWDGRS